MKMDTSSDIFQSRQYKLNRILLSMLGQWPFQKERYRRGIFLTVAFIGISQFITQVLALVTLRHNVDAILEAIPPLLVNSLCVVKITSLIYNTKEIKILLMHIQKDWQSWVIDSEFEILHQFAEKGRTITIRYATGMYAFGCLFPFLAIIPKIVGKNVTSAYSTRPVGFPYHVEYFVDLNKYYYPALIHNYLATSIRLTILVATDTCTIILIIHCCALFAIIRYRLEHIRISIEQDKGLAFLEEDEKMYKNFVYCIKKHEDAIQLVLLQFANCVENIFKNALSAEVCITVLMMSLSALQATTETLTPQLAIRHGAYILAQLLLLFIICWLGQQIIDHSDRVYSSIYRGEWYEASIRSQKLLSMIMLRSSSPSTLTIGKIMVLSLPSFSAIVRASASYFTVLRSVR